MKNYIKEKVQALTPSMVACRRDLHKHPETGWTEFRTAAMAITRMKELGYTITMGKDAVKQSAMMGVPSEEELKEHQKRAIAQGADKALVEAMTGGLTGFWAEMKFSDEKPLLALRFDIDANDAIESKDPVHKPTKEGFNSINDNVMHACGHDGHVAIGLAVAEIVAGMKDKLKGSIRFIFQSAEEGLRGAAPMVAAGAVKNVDQIIGMHIGFHSGKQGVIYCGTDDFLASTKLDVNFYGVSSHAGGAPQEGKNALLAAAVAALNLHAISRHSDGTTRINVGKLTAGVGRNVLPPNASLIMETRGSTTQLNDFMEAESRRMIEAAAKMYDCTYDISITGGTKSGISDDKMIELIKEEANDMPCFETVGHMKGLGAGEDFAHMMSDVQAAGGIGSYVLVGAALTAGHHNDKFDFDEVVLTNSAELIARSAGKILAK